MSFSIIPEYVEGYARMCDRAADDARAVKDYVAASEFPRDAQGWLALFGDMHRTLQDEMGGRVHQIASAMRGSATELENAVRYYRGTDRAAAERADAAYPNGGR